MKILDESQVNDIMDMLTRVSQLDFSTKLKMNGGETELDSITKGLNKMSEELEHQLIKLKEKEGNFNALVENAPLDIIIIDKEAKIQYINRVAPGFDKEKVIGLNAFDFISPEHHAKVKAVYQEVFDTGNVGMYELAGYANADGTIGWYKTMVGAIKKNGITESLVLMYFDITDRKKAEERIIELNKELEITNKELESFTYSVSHDLRTPLRAINGLTNILERDYKDNIDDEGKRLMNTVIEESKRMGKLIDDLLAFSRLGKKELQKTNTDMTALAQSVLKSFSNNDLINKTIKVDNLIAAFVDNNLFYQVYANLISNALKYSRLKSNPTIEIGSYEGDNENIYFIKDNGAGFDMRYYDKLFNVFQRLHSIEEFEGTGVGLAIVNRIVTKHGGRAWAEGKVDEGATFYFSLPKS